MSRLRVGMLGYGAVAHEHAAVLNASSTADFVAVIGPRKERAEQFASAHGKPAVFADFDAAFEEVSMDAIIVASPTDVHVLQAKAAVNAGLHVLVEFPLHAATRNLYHLFEIAEKTGRLLAVAHTSRFSWSFRQTKYLIEQGTLGRCKCVSFVRLLHRPPGTGAASIQRTWNDDVLLHHGAHALDLCHYWFGSDVTPAGVIAPTESSGRRNAGLLLRGPEGLPISSALTYDASSPALRATLTMAGGVIEIDGFARLRINGNDETVARPNTDEDAYHDGIARQDTAFIEGVRGKAPFPVPPSETIHLNETLTRALALAETG